MIAWILRSSCWPFKLPFALLCFALPLRQSVSGPSHSSRAAVNEEKSTAMEGTHRTQAQGTHVPITAAGTSGVGGGREAGTPGRRLVSSTAGSAAQQRATLLSAHADAHFNRPLFLFLRPCCLRVLHAAPSLAVLLFAVSRKRRAKEAPVQERRCSRRANKSSRREKNSRTNARKCARTSVKARDGERRAAGGLTAGGLQRDGAADCLSLALSLPCLFVCALVVASLPQVPDGGSVAGRFPHGRAEHGIGQQDGLHDQGRKRQSAAAARSRFKC
jgi:hypothetical protein